MKLLKALLMTSLFALTTTTFADDTSEATEATSKSKVQVEIFDVEVEPVEQINDDATADQEPVADEAQPIYGNPEDILTE